MKADAERIEALAYELIDTAFELYAGNFGDALGPIRSREFAAVWCCNEDEVPAIIDKARNLLPKQGRV